MGVFRYSSWEPWDLSIHISTSWMKKLRLRECGRMWVGRSPFSRGSAFWYNSLLSYSCLSRIYGSYVIYREINFFQRSSWAVFLGFNPQETESWKLKHKSEKRREKKWVLQNDPFFKARDLAYRQGRSETHHSYWLILQEGGEGRWDIWPPKQPLKAAPIWGE